MNSDLSDLLLKRLHLTPHECARKVVVITGAGRGIGMQAAHAFALLGGSVVIAELSEEGKKIETDICRSGGRALYIPTDVSSLESVKHLVEAAHQAFGPVDILVNNAIRIASASVVNMDLALWDEIIAVNLRGTFLTCKAFLPDMLQRQSGVVINMVSTPMPGLSAYAASKQGILGFSQALALEVGQAGLQVVPFVPGMVDTPGIRSVAGDLAPRLGLSQDQFLKFSMHSAYDGFMPPEHAGVATVYLALRLAQEYHGQLVTGYEVLEKAGMIQPTLVEASPETVSATTLRKANNETVTELLKEVQGFIEESVAQFAKMPPFFRPMARNGFKSKSGASLDEWQRSLKALQEAAKAGELQAESAHGMASRLEKLSTYYQEEPRELARFTRDKDLLREAVEISSRRVQTILELIACLKQL